MDSAAVDADIQRQVAALLCELSRKILLRLQSVAHMTPSVVEEVLGLFRRAAQVIQTHGDVAIEGYVENICTRADYLEQVSLT